MAKLGSEPRQAGSGSLPMHSVSEDKSEITCKTKCRRRKDQRQERQLGGTAVNSQRENNRYKQSKEKGKNFQCGTIYLHSEAVPSAKQK